MSERGQANSPALLARVLCDRKGQQHDDDQAPHGERDADEV